MTAVLEVLNTDELSGAKLVEIFGHAYINATLDSDGDVKVVLDGVNMLIKVEPARKTMHLITLFGAKPGATRMQVLELCNRINDGLIMIRAAYPAAFPTPCVMLDHYLITEAGVTGLEVVDEVRRFRTVVGIVPPLDTEGILK